MIKQNPSEEGKSETKSITPSTGVSETSSQDNGCALAHAVEPHGEPKDSENSTNQIQTVEYQLNQN